MADRSKIEWCDATWNPVTGCTPVSAGCEHCYAKRLAERFPQIHGVDFARVTVHPERMEQPLHWRKPRRIFVCSMGDLFHPDVPPEAYSEIVTTMVRTPWHTYLILTKRPREMQTLMAESGGSPPGHIWFGVTAEDQASADERIPILQQMPAALRFVSCEPLLEPVRLNLDGIGWVIAGPETGPGARPCSKGWIAALWGQCVDAGVPFFLKRLPRGLPPGATPPQDFPAPRATA